MSDDPFLDLLELRELIGDQLGSSLTTKGLTYWQQLCEIQCTCEDTAEHNIDTNEFISLYTIWNEIERILQEHQLTTHTEILILFDLKFKLIPQDAMKIFPKDIHNWVNNTDYYNLNEWIQLSLPLICTSIKMTQSNETYPFWSKHTQSSQCTICINFSVVYTKKISIKIQMFLFIWLTFLL